MIINKGYKYRIYPNDKQIQIMNQCFGNARFVYNYFLNLKEEEYKRNNKTLSAYETMKLLTSLKKELPWLKSSDSMSLQEVLKDLDRAYKAFFKGNSKHPVFQSKRNDQTYRTRNQSDSIRIEGNAITLPKLGKVKIRYSRPVRGRILNATLSKTKTGKYFVSLCSESDESVKHNNGGTIGLDVGVKELYTDSNGRKTLNPKHLKHHMKKLIKGQRKLSRMIDMKIVSYKTIGNKRIPVYEKPLNEYSNIRKQRIKIAKIHETISNSRNDFLHKVSTTLVKENQIICVEDLNVKEMVKNHRLAKEISDVSWSRFFNMLEYKSKEYGCDIIKIPRFYASSQNCNCCGYVNRKIRDLKIRKWTCPNCGAQHDRDTNAAINILNKGLSLMA